MDIQRWFSLMDVSANPGPVNSEITISPRRLRNGIADLNSPAKRANGTLSSVYSKEQLFALKTRAPVPSNVYQLLKQREIFRSRYTRSKKKAKKAKSKINNFQAPSFSPFENGHSYYSYSGSLNLNNNDTSNNSQHLQPLQFASRRSIILCRTTNSVAEIRITS